MPTIESKDLPPEVMARINASDKPRKPSVATGIIAEDGMNKMERAYRDRLELMKRRGDIRDYRPHPFSLKLAENFHYRPDFIVFENDLSLTIVETKGGFIREDAETKFKAAKVALPFLRFRMDQYKKGSWTTIRELA